MDPVVTSSASNTCAEPISSNCVQVTSPVPGVQSICYPATLTQILAALGTVISGGSSGLGNVTIPGIDLGCLYSSTVGTCPAGWTFVPATATTAAYCSNGCPPGFNNIGFAPDGSVLCAACPSFSPCPPPVPTYIPNPVPAPTTLAGYLQLIITFLQPFCICNPCTASANANPNCPDGNC
jgi:hypothetical protein